MEYYAEVVPKYGNLNIRKIPDLDSDVVAQTPRDCRRPALTKHSVKHLGHKWIKVRCKNKLGWLNSYYVTIRATNKTQPTQEAEPLTFPGMTFEYPERKKRWFQPRSPSDILPPPTLAVPFETAPTGETATVPPPLAAPTVAQIPALKKGYVGPLRFDSERSEYMIVLEDFAYVDSNLVRWDVPKGFKTDGASLPRYVWSFYAAPFSGPWKEAAAIHDRYCQTKERTWQETHGVFYDAMLASGVDTFRAMIMYTSVYYGGPRWITKQNVCWGADCRSIATIQGATIYPVITLEGQLAIQRWVFENAGASIEQAMEFIRGSNFAQGATIRGAIQIRGLQHATYLAHDDVVAPSNWREW